MNWLAVFDLKPLFIFFCTKFSEEGLVLRGVLLEELAKVSVDLKEAPVKTPIALVKMFLLSGVLTPNPGPQGPSHVPGPHSTG